MSSEDFHGDLISKLDPETVAKALERYNKKHSTAGVRTDNGMVSYISSKIKADDSQASTPSVIPKIRKNSSPTRCVAVLLVNTTYYFQTFLKWETTTIFLDLY